MISGTNLRDALTVLQSAELGRRSGTLRLQDGRYVRLVGGLILDCTLPVPVLLDALPMPWTWRNDFEEGKIFRLVEKAISSTGAEKTALTLEIIRTLSKKETP